MAQFKRGLKAGLVAGIISGLVFGIILTLLNVLVFHEIIVQAVDQAISQIPEEILESEDFTLNRESMITFAIYGSLLMPVVLVIPGLIIGLLFAGLFSHLPGKTAIRKGMVLGLVLWIIGSIFDLLGLAASLEDTYSILGLSLGLTNQLFFGYLLGKFWIKFEK